MKLDPWQQEIMEYEDNILLAKGRRIGATHTFGKKAVDFMATHSNKHPSSQIVCVSLTEDQAQLIIAFATNYAKEKYPKLVGKGKNKPTLNRLTLVVGKEKRILLARPVGATGDAVRGFEGQILMVDEAPKMPKLFWAAARPILATTGGKIWMWGTFFGKDNYFYKQYVKCLNKPGRFKVWNKNTEEVFEEREISEDWTEKQRKEALQFLEDERNDLSKLEYAQEYLAMASEDLTQLFSDDLIYSIMDLEIKSKFPGKKYLGVDVAREGGDEFVEFGINKISENRIEEEVIQVKKNLTIPQGADSIISLDKIHNFKRIYVDDGGLGAGTLDLLKLNPQTRRKSEGINNKSKPINFDETRKRKILKEDLYANLLTIMQRGILHIRKSDEVFMSLKSVQVQHLEGGHIKIFGKNTHIAEALVRAVWGIKEKHLNIWIR